MYNTIEDLAPWEKGLEVDANSELDINYILQQCLDIQVPTPLVSETEKEAAREINTNNVYHQLDLRIRRTISLHMEGNNFHLLSLLK